MATRWMRRREEAQNEAAIYFTTTMSNRDGIGAKVTVIAEDHKICASSAQRFELYLK
jgi:hypothetical protein